MDIVATLSWLQQVYWVGGLLPFLTWENTLLLEGEIDRGRQDLEWISTLTIPGACAASLRPTAVLTFGTIMTREA